jgi:hypothetical protein
MAVAPDRFWWEDGGCLQPDVRVAPICQRERLPVGDCPPGATFDGHCYLAVTGPLRSWRQAEDYCVINGGHLTSVHSQAEADFIVGLVGSSADYMWLGASDIHTEVPLLY